MFNAPASAAPQREPVHFLIVDDLEENLISMEALLRRDGLVLLTAKSGSEALELLLKHDVALAFLDVQMPQMDGFELAELMRGTGKTVHVPIIFLTAGTGDYQRRFRGYEAGAVDFLQKPIEPDVLKSKAHVFYELYRQRQEVAQQRDELKIIAEENKRLLAESQEYLQTLREADRRKDEFLATLAHELRNPLAPVRNGLALLAKPDETQKSPEIIPMMERQLVHLVRLIDDLLDVSRVSHGKVELKKEIITFQSALQSAVETSKALIDDRKHRLELNAPDEPIWLMADPTRLAQIISNLLNNAAKYSPPGGKITVAARQEKGEAVIDVTDTGIGIPPDMLSKVFELFTQVDNKLERSEGGLGIGLALVQQLITLHGGSITAISAGKGRGSTFTFRMPLADTPSNNAPVRGATVAKPAIEALPADEDRLAPLLSNAKRILVVDDNVDSAKTTGYMLEMLGHDYKLAHDGEAALEVARSFRPDIILLDIGLPKMNGYEVCRALREDPAFKDTILIAQTGWGQPKDKRLAEEAGFNHHLVKPVPFEKFAELIGKIA